MMMLARLLPLLFIGSSAAMPLFFNETSICQRGLCEKTEMKYERISVSQPGYQWDDAGGAAMLSPPMHASAQLN
jgi:hypothetical protein